MNEKSVIVISLRASCDSEGMSEKNGNKNLVLLYSDFKTKSCQKMKSRTCSFCKECEKRITVRACRDSSVMLFTLLAVRAFCFKYRTCSEKSQSSNKFFLLDILQAFVIVLWLTSSSSQHRSLASMTSPSSKNSARMTKSNWALNSSILASTFAWFSMSGVARPRSHSCWFWGET